MQRVRVKIYDVKARQTVESDAELIISTDSRALVRTDNGAVRTVDTGAVTLSYLPTEAS